MVFDFTVEPEYQESLRWARTFVESNVHHLDVLWPNDVYAPLGERRQAVVDRLRNNVKANNLWATHLGREHGGQGFGQVKLGLLNEVLGTSLWAPRIFGSQAPDSGNAEILARFGSREQKERFLEPLLRGDIVSTFCMTEPQGGGDPGIFETTALQDGDDWVIDGHKFFATNARWANFFIVMAITDPGASTYSSMTMFLVPADTPGIEIELNMAHTGEPADNGSEGLMRFTGVRVPDSARLGDRGGAFAVAQTRLGGGRVHHAMRSVGLAQRALDMLAERALSRTTKGSLLADKQLVQAMLADSWIELTQFRLLVLYTAWKIDKHNDYNKVRAEIAAVKVETPRVLESIARRAIQVHGALGTTYELPLNRFLGQGLILALADGPTEVHKVNLARTVLKGYEPAPTLWPTEYVPYRREAAEKWLADQYATTA